MNGPRCSKGGGGGGDAIHKINICSADSPLRVVNIYPWDSHLSRSAVDFYLIFEQLSPDRQRNDLNLLIQFDSDPIILQWFLTFLATMVSQSKSLIPYFSTETVLERSTLYGYRF